MLRRQRQRRQHRPRPLPLSSRLLRSAAAMVAQGLIDREVLAWTVAGIPAAYAGNWIGTWAFHRAKPHHHKATALIVLSILSAVLIVRALVPG